MPKIVKSHRGIYYVEKDGKVYLCKARGLFRNNNVKPIVGDEVDISINEDGTAYINKVYDRKNQLLRPPISNVDQVLVIMSLSSPDLNLYLLDKYLLMLELSSIETKIIFNKIDLVDEEYSKRVKSIYSEIGYDIYLNSNIKDNSERFLPLFKNKTTVVTGPSGVGKSTTLNRVFSHFNFETGEISTKSSRGKHTTRHIEISRIDKDSYVIDTPGFSALSLDFLESEQDVSYGFREFQKYSTSCKFNNCVHENEPACAVKNAIRENKISNYRYENYLRILREFKNLRGY
ncbi:ribosome small subunit-dependent GTPase A [Lagierella sp.]|uniref:ribosome small subunit-dependent GTPase A n=1 Tax=Lagierella sp. TaxID=2849657 RepID=UPI0026092164|nr:ribosome small subunit-dependent GTPase A [Lagierella sp.]